MIRQQRDPQSAWLTLHAWYRTPLGRLFAEVEEAALGRVLTTLFGYHGLILGLPSERDLLAASRIVHHYRVEIAPLATVAVDFRAEPARLPIAGDSIDVVVVAHLLEFTSDPSAMLREIERVLIPEGHVIILGFNPLSWWGLPRLWRHGRQRCGPWLGDCRTTLHWQMPLRNLGFDILATHYHFYRPPLTGVAWLDKLAFLEQWGTQGWGCGGGYVLLAQKRVSTLTPIRPRWRPRRRLATEGVVNGAWRGPHDGY